MIHINIFCIGKVKEKFFLDSIKEYSKRLSKYCMLNFFEFPDIPLPKNLNSSIATQIIDAESESMMNKLKPASYNIALDSRGKQYTSEEFAELLNKIQNNNSTINFLIGGSLGLNSSIKNQSNEIISFSKMTFPHQLMRVFLLEQIFRAFKINNNEKYHH